MDKVGNEDGGASSLRQARDGPSRARTELEAERVQPNKHRALQIARTGGRKLFEGEAKRVFLEWFAATCNVKMSADRAGFNYKTAFRHRMNDPDFAEGWDRALEQGVARLKAKLLETRAKESPVGIEGDLDAPEMEEVDPAIAIPMIREHERRAAGYPKTGRPPLVASNEEVRAALVKRLAAFGVRVAAGRDAGDEEGGNDGENPPRSGEDL